MKQCTFKLSIMRTHQEIVSEVVRSINLPSRPTGASTAHSRYLEEVKSEQTCDQCGQKMTFRKGRKRKKYGKSNDYYVCPYCDHIFRKRTQNEILRDLGLRE